MKKLICLIGVFLTGHALAADDSKRPNVVFIFSDDHAFQAISAYGNERKLAQTPNIDRLAKEGVRFDRCLVTNSLCGPSRATILTGKYNHLNGFVNNTNRSFDNSQSTFPKLLQKAGYQTAIVGKWHLVSDPTGFDFWQILYDQGVYYNPPMNRMGIEVATSGYETDINTDVALEWLKSRDEEKPFLLMCQNKAPHREWQPPLRYLVPENDRVFPEPTTLFDDYSGRGVAVKTQDMTIEKTLNDHDLKLVAPAELTAEQRSVWDAYYEPRNREFREAKLTGRDLVRWKYQRYLHDYVGAVRAVDENVGRLLKYLDDTGLAENTIVVYASDQGFFLGEHGWFDKRWIFEESLRTPLLIRWPGVAKAGLVVKDIVSNVDFAETFLEAAGIPVPSDMQGRSLVPLLEGKTPQDWRTSFYYQYYEYPAWHKVRPHYGVVTDRYKLVHFHGTADEYWELFDLAKDPLELRSVYGEPAYSDVQKELLKELKQQRTDLKVPETVPADWYGGVPRDLPKWK